MTSGTPRAQGYPSTKPSMEQKRCVDNSPPHPFGVGWGGELSTLKSSSAKSIALVRHYTPRVPHNREEVDLGHLEEYTTVLRHMKSGILSSHTKS